ncbi:MAG: Arc family DNA-binding protein [Clostridia bacterium]|nr:Arc family DNA-binding protein [Clostridia bacterium]
MAVKSVSIRIEEEMLRKLTFVADYEGRSVNSHVLALVRESIRAFEKDHGPAEMAITPDVNVKPGKKE